MRLAVIFLGVLAASVLLVSLAAWGITYGMSYNRVTTMSAEFTTLTHTALGQFDSFVAELLQDNSGLVENILTQERISGEERLRETKASTAKTIGTLVNYTANATDQSQAQMNEVVDTFATLMGSVVADFKGVATGYAAQLRAELASKASTTLRQSITARMVSLQRYQTLSVLGMLNLSQAPWDPIGADDCTLLANLCADAQDAGAVELALATGRSYSCRSGKEASISFIINNGTQYTQQLLKWVPDVTSHLVTRQRCLTQAPASIVTVGQNCPQPQGCSCGQDTRCTAWYMQHMTAVSPSLAAGEVVRSATGSLISPISFSVFSPNTSTSSPALLGVVTLNADFVGIDRYLASLTSSSSTLLALVTNHSTLPLVGTTGVKCAANVTPPGDPALPTWSGLRSCDSGLRAVVQWLAQNRTAAWASASLQITGVVWDVFPSNLGVMSYYLIVATPLAVINAAVDASDARASGKLTNVRAQQLSRVAAIGAEEKAYIAALGEEEARNLQAMESKHAAQITALETSSRAVLVSSQQRSTIQVQQLMDSQTIQISALTSRHLLGMSITTGWTIGVVFAILLAVLLCSAWGTVRVTNDLTSIIGLMEDVADMKVEDLAVPRTSHVTEVARIETAFQVLVRRLAEYKSYIPAGVFEKLQAPDEPELECVASGREDTQISVSDHDCPGRVRSPISGRKCPTTPHGAIQVPRCGSISVSSASASGARQRVAALSFFVFDFTEVLLHMAPSLAKALLSQHVTHVHEAAHQSRGNVEFVAGDQILVTFNAHIICGDPAGAALTAALEMQRHISRERLKFQIGIAFGSALAGSVGYAKFRSMATVGYPIKVASMISQMSDFESGTVLVDANVEDKMKYTYDLRPVEAVHFPQLKLPAVNTPMAQSVFLVHAKRHLQEDEWLYQVDKLASSSDWTAAFAQVVEAKALGDACGCLQKYLAAHPQDPVALRLLDRMAMWTPGLGLPLWDRAEHADSNAVCHLP